MRTIKFPLSKPDITQKEENVAIKVLRSGWLTQGRYVKLIESRLRQYNRIRYAFMFNSGTSGLIASVKALGLESKDEIICPAFTFPATANSIILGGAEPVFCDIKLDTFNIDVGNISRLITKKTKAIMVVSEFGLPADLPEIMRLAKRYNLSVIEDAACALGARIREKKVGSFGDVAVFSFHPRKLITCGEGGAVITDSGHIAEKIQLLRNHGLRNNKFIGCGYNFRLSDIQAAILMSQFKRIDNTIKKRIALAQNYNQLLRPMEILGYLKLPQSPKDYRHVYQTYCLLLSNSINRDKLKNLLRKKGIETQIGGYCIPSLDFYKKNFKFKLNSFKNAFYAFRNSLTLPLYNSLKMEEQGRIAEVLLDAIRLCSRRRT
ncbi:MAG: DegT/DnrJ/EryC1/StrS family aminotransferase [Candidatus Omnitrophica bacterium]|nr:DegT/DnrJ/EryC1/StrS family aminotransferase [Candidatus Omnitrophota bacterium]